MSEFDRIAAELRNWGRWGEADELGTLNLITPATVRDSAQLVKRGDVFPLGIDFGSNGPQGVVSFRGNPIHYMVVDGGDGSDLAYYARTWVDNPIAQAIGARFDSGRFRFNEDGIIMPLQAATQWDALSHVYYDGLLYNGYPSVSVSSQGAARCSIDKVDVKGISSRGVLLDVGRHRSANDIDPDRTIGRDELDQVAAAQGVVVGVGDIVMVRTGWYSRFIETRDPTVAVAGLDWRCAAWLHDRDVAAIAADNMAVEDLRPSVDGLPMPMHCICLRDMGMMFGELWNLDGIALDCAFDGIYEFLIVAPPLRVTGGVGSPVNPIALK
jgi:kynurenine formamidase